MRYGSRHSIDKIDQCINRFPEHLNYLGSIFLKENFCRIDVAMQISLYQSIYPTGGAFASISSIQVRSVLVMAGTFCQPTRKTKTNLLFQDAIPFLKPHNAGPTSKYYYYAEFICNFIYSQGSKHAQQKKKLLAPHALYSLPVVSCRDCASKATNDSKKRQMV